MHRRESVTIRCTCELDADTPADRMYTTQREERTGIAQHNTHYRWLLTNPRERRDAQIGAYPASEIGAKKITGDRNKIVATKEVVERLSNER